MRVWSHQLSRLPRDSPVVPGCALCAYDPDGQRLKNTTRKLADLTFIDVYGRIHRSLIQLTTLPEAMTHPDGMQIRVTRQELGKLVGCSREMAGRVLKMLEGDGYITVAGKTIVVLREPANSLASKINQ